MRQQRYDASIIPTYSEDGSIVTIIVTNLQAAVPLSQSELIEALEAFIHHLKSEEEDAN